MMPRIKRLSILCLALCAIGIAVALVLNAFRSNIVFFFTPTQVVGEEAPKHRNFRVGGLVVPGSLHRDGINVSFQVTDTAKTIPVRYQGILPDLFKDGKGVVAQGQLDVDGVFVAHEILAKHDENYMPPESADAIARAKSKVAGANSLTIQASRHNEAIPANVSGERE